MNLIDDKIHTRMSKPKMVEEVISQYILAALHRKAGDKAARNWSWVVKGSVAEIPNGMFIDVDRPYVYDGINGDLCIESRSWIDEMASAVADNFFAQDRGLTSMILQCKATKLETGRYSAFITYGGREI